MVAVVAVVAVAAVPAVPVVPVVPAFVKHPPHSSHEYLSTIDRITSFGISISLTVSLPTRTFFVI